MSRRYRQWSASPPRPPAPAALVEWPLTQRCPRTPRFLWGPSSVHSSSFHGFPVPFLPLESEHTRAGRLADYLVPSGP